MEQYNKQISERTIPLILYLVSSFLVVFVSNLNSIIVILFIFLFVSSTLFNQKTLQKIIVTSLIIILLVMFLSMLINFDFSYQTLLLSLPKSISLSILITSAIAFFVYLPTIQLYYITRTITRSEYPAYAILSAFRSFPVFFNFSKKIFTTIKIRKAYSSFFNFLLLYIQNVFIEFFDFLDNFINHFTYIDLVELKITPSVTNVKFYILSSYLLTILILIAYGK